ncbi:MAG TPA: response regulator [Deltaproteobacteria bacterium]|nr:response regulator [Deltaproteobacteria bacterium]HQB37692.1 response regulator [Deltaproteobacteria bacterium]
MSTSVLIVEDEQKLSSLLADYLQQAGYETLCTDNGLTAAGLARVSNPGLVLLDLMLPGRDGLEICKEIRAFSSVPIIMLTARIEEIDRLLGLELGADDYICKPFSPREVVARVKAVLRRSDPPLVPTGRGLTMDELRHQATLCGQPLELTAVEFKLLKILYSAPGRIYTRSQLMNRIYPDVRVVSDRTIDSHVKKLRKKLALLQPERELIHSVYGVGYKYECNAE